MITEKRELKNVPLTDLIPYARNPRKNDPAVQRVAASLKEYGFVKNSIVVDEDMVLITGHTTMKAMQALKWATAPEVTQVFGLTEAQKKAYRIADNKLGELAAWDEELLALEFEDLKGLDFDLDQTGFDDKELGKILDAGKEASEDDYEPPVEIETSIQRGDLFRLGRHRLLCGDATSAEDVGRLMDGGRRTWCSPIRRTMWIIRGRPQTPSRSRTIRWRGGIQGVSHRRICPNGRIFQAGCASIRLSC